MPKPKIEQIGHINMMELWLPLLLHRPESVSKNWRCQQALCKAQDGLFYGKLGKKCPRNLAPLVNCTVCTQEMG